MKLTTRLLAFALSLPALCGAAAAQASNTYVPLDVEDAVAALNARLSVEEKATIAGLEWSDLAAVHTGLGQEIAREWGLWQGSRLALFFREQGVQHPGDMAVFVLDTYWLYLNDKPMSLETRFEAFRGGQRRVQREAKRQHDLWAAFTAFAIGRFLFDDKTEGAYQPMVRAGYGPVVGYDFLSMYRGRMRWSLAARASYVHTLARYNHRFPEEQRGLGGYADIFRLSLGGSLKWLFRNRKFDQEGSITILVGSATAWFERVTMAGFNYSIVPTIGLWFTEHLGLFASFPFEVEQLPFVVTHGAAARRRYKNTTAEAWFWSGEIGPKLRF